MVLLALSVAALSCRGGGGGLDWDVVEIAAGPDFENRLRQAFVEAVPGTILRLPAGTFQFEGSLTLESSHVVVSGQGMGTTILDFSGQRTGSEAILARGDHFAIEGLTIRDPVGTGVKTEFVDGATFSGVRVEWSRGADPDNGDYGLYPAESRHVLVDGCVVRGARDAGIYVGQSENVVVRYSLVKENVLGIEIENSINADVYWNLAFDNTGGIAVFNLPDLKDGFGTRVFRNYVTQNNTPNFAAGGILAMVPGGTGIVAIGAKQAEIFDNYLADNQTVNLIVSSFLIAQEPIHDADYDPYAEHVEIHDNAFGPGDQAPQGQLGILASVLFMGDVPDIALGGYADPDKIPGFDPDLYPYASQILPENKICVHDNTDASVGSLDGLRPLGDVRNVEPFDCSHAPRLPVAIPPPTEPPDATEGYTPEEIAALCEAPGVGVNWDAFVVNCPRLSDYRFFAGADPRVDPNPGGVPYDLTTPLFSDYAQKDRFLFLPPGAAMTYSEEDVFDMPVGTIIVKTFSWLDDVSGPVPQDVLVETRLLIRRENGWQGLPYVWSEDGSEALLQVTGGTRQVSFTDTQGDPQTIQYAIPDMGQCGSCHFGDPGDVPIGPKARLLNRDFDYAGGAENQLTHLSAAGLLVGAPANPADAPRLPFWNDPSDGTLEERARAYLESNCAHCHNAQGRAGFTSLHLVHDHPLDQIYGICKRPIAAGSGAGNLRWDIVPGSPEESILIFRLADTRPAIMMPELSKAVAHDPGVELVSDWIASLSGSCD